ncbi:MAG: hypothetical protein NC299_17800 [Lachnospiraceae bacterium]|nr:hypothetical protein [Ruminococcus sp.]MCM1277182.1 hypothetical protein [Lachnospiraceae bacterium]
MKIKLSVDTHCIKNTPKDKIPYSTISKTIAQHPCELSVEEIAEVIENGYTICSPVFTNGEKKKENIAEMRLFILDFDNKDKPLSYGGALKRAKNYNLSVAISYETKSSENFNRYRLIFLYSEPVHDMGMMNVINQLLLRIFPEADNTKDLSKMFLPGRNVRFHCGKPFRFDTLVVAARSFCCSNVGGSKSTWVNLLNSFNNKYGLIIQGTDIFTSDEITPSQFGTFALRSIYYNMEGITKVPKNSMGRYVYFAETANCPKLKRVTAPALQLKDFSVARGECQLIRDFADGKRLAHEEWFGLATNLIGIKGGQSDFKNTLNKYSHIQAYLDTLENLPEDAHIFTTHSRLFRMSEKITENAVVFIDEDIIPSMIGCSAVSVEEFNRLYNAVCDDVLKDKLHKIKENIVGDSHYFQLEKNYFAPDYKAQILKDYSAKDITFTQNIWGLAESDNFYYCAADNSVHFTVTNRLKYAKKIIMMSATANEDICRKVFGNPMYFCDVGQISYKGKVIIHCDKSYSRNYLSLNNAEKAITEIVNKHGDCAYITFKEHCKYIDGKYPRTHYGQAVGTNDLSGENLVVIGLNHRPFYVYELFARALGIYRDDTLSTRKTQLYGFEFFMMTYADTELRNIQQYMIGSDLEQAIGRARLIYHDCAVHLYGNFPARQGVLENEVEREK